MITASLVSGTKLVLLFSQENERSGQYLVLKKTGNISIDQNLTAFLFDEASSDGIAKAKVPVDFLISNQSPENNEPLRKLLGELACRYHFSSSNGSSYFEAKPYASVDSEGRFLFATRYISLAPALSQNEKWIYALNLTPFALEKAEVLEKKPDHLVNNPYLTSVVGLPDDSLTPNFFFQTTAAAGVKRNLDSGNHNSKKPREGYVCKRCHSDQHYFKDCPHPDTSYICHICHEPGHKIQNCPKKTRQGKVDSSAPDSCWFCLSNPAVRKHLIIHIGDEVYVTLAKGGLLPEHFLVIPIEHHASTAALKEPICKEALETLKSISRSLKSDLFVWAHRHNPGHHLHLQAVSIPSNTSEDLSSFVESFSTDKSYSIEAGSGRLGQDFSGFICLHIAEGDIKREWGIPVESGAYFPANFGRELAANFLNLADRLDWRLSPLTEKEESDLVQGFKHSLKFS